MKDIVINNRYRVDREIATGGFGAVHYATDLQTGEEMALKLGHVEDCPEVGMGSIKTEKEKYDVLAGGVGIPRALWYGLVGDYQVMAFELAGPSLVDLYSYCDGVFSLRTVLMIADQAISRIEYMHSKGILHRDIKPENFLMGSGKQGHILYVVDFGLARAAEHAAIARNFGGRTFQGTIYYSSINNHYLREQSWGDDLESLGYMLIYLLRGSLPWEPVESGSMTEHELGEITKLKKSNVTGAELAIGLPDAFARYIDYTRGLKFEDRPNYKYLRQGFRRVFAAKGYKYDNVYDWTEKLYKEMQGNGNP